MLLQKLMDLKARLNLTAAAAAFAEKSLLEACQRQAFQDIAGNVITHFSCKWWAMSSGR